MLIVVAADSGPASLGDTVADMVRCDRIRGEAVYLENRSIEAEVALMPERAK